jgi:hypothetical protein
MQARTGRRYLETETFCILTLALGLALDAGIVVGVEILGLVLDVEPLPDEGLGPRNLQVQRGDRISHQNRSMAAEKHKKKHRMLRLRN